MAIWMCTDAGFTNVISGLNVGVAGVNRHEHRQLGVAVRQIIVHRPGVMTSFDPDGPVFAEGGCHPAESGYSWTDGELHLPAPLFAHLKGALTLIIHTQKHAMRYPVAAALAKAA